MERFLISMYLFRCSGPNNTVGEGGCDACDTVVISNDGLSVSQCLNATSECPDRHFMTSQPVASSITAVLKEGALDKVRSQCEPFS